MLDTARDRVAAAGRRLAAAGLVVATAGNISEREGDRVAITPTGAVLAELRPEQVAVVDLDGGQLDGPLAPTSELELHLGVYGRYEAGAVVHTHSPLATTLSCVLDELPVIHYHLLMAGGPIRVAPYRTYGTPELAKVTLDALQDRGAALMANHGAITQAHNLDTAVELSLILEWACSVYWHAQAIGNPRVLDAAQQREFFEAVARRGYGTKSAATAEEG
ncbi:MAG TPA: class II aldolase/adducin family protein [Solirubrobacteraceae bacterium]|nr:class II aldolase/adducin family protein [Solirubrobacteraceae bacterium]